MDVLIAGAGIGGLALAGGLLARGHRVRVLERTPGLGTGGAAVTIFSNGAAALADLGAPLDDIGGVLDELEFCRADGTTLARADLRIMRRRTGFPVVTVPRHALLTHLARHLPGDLIQFDHAVDSVEVASDRVSVVDRYGARYTADVLVGADGYRSTVRQATLDDPPASGTGWVTWQGLSPVLPDLADGALGRCLVDPAGFCGLLPAGAGLLQWWFDVPAAATEPPPRSMATWLRTRFAHFAEPVPELLRAITDADIGRYPHLVHQVPTRWGTGPTTLVGDAAHVFPPSQAQGANQALEDAWLLTRALDVPANPTELLRRYERRRATRARRVSRMAASEITVRPPGRAGTLAARILTPRIAGHAYLSLIRRFSSVLNNDHI